MTAFIADWLNLLIRWGHLIVGIGWIGTSFYFIALDLALRKRPGLPEGVMGSAWEVHGGGFYHVQKYAVAPRELPDDLLWYKWEAYLTWVTGFGLLIVQYYVKASTYLIDPSVLTMTPGEATVISLATLAAGWFVYDLICRSSIGRNTPLLAVAVFALIMLASYGYTHIYSGRGALIHVGAFIGTLMAVNVFGIIVPNQKKITAALLAGREPDPAMGEIGKQRSVHNNYLTLPVLVMMVSNHYPMLTNHPHAWLLVGLIIIIGAMVRHFFNRHDAGDPISRIVWTLPVAAAALAVAIVMTAPRPTPAMGGKVSDAQAMAITHKHCIACHSTHPANEMFAEPPKGVRLGTVEQLHRYADQVLVQAVQSDAMPLGNVSGMTQKEREMLGAWIAQQ